MPKQNERYSNSDNYLNRSAVAISKKVHVHLFVNWRIIAFKSILYNEHLVEIKNNEDLPGITYAKANDIFGSEIYLNVRKVSHIITGFDRNTLSHEFGHSLGLLHPDLYSSWLSGQYWSSSKQSKDSFNFDV